MPGRDYDPNRVLAAFVTVILLEPFAQALHLDAHNAIGFGIKIRRPPKCLRGDSVFLEAVEIPREGLFDDKLEKQSRRV
jgi:hypothetical protein